MSEFMGLIYGNYEAKVRISVINLLSHLCGVIESLSTLDKLKYMPDHGGNRTHDLWMQA